MWDDEDDRPLSPAAFTCSGGVGISSWLVYRYHRRAFWTSRMIEACRQAEIAQRIREARGRRKVSMRDSE